MDTAAALAVEATVLGIFVGTLQVGFLIFDGQHRRNPYEARSMNGRWYGNYETAEEATDNLVWGVTGHE
jgi:hypothetical protein